MDSTARLLAIMPMYNSERYLREAIKSILSQTFKDFRLIIVDDNSTDRSTSIAKGFADDRILVVENPRRIGLAKSLNLALKSDQAEYVARHDADDVSFPARFEKQLAFMSRHPNVGLLGTSYFLMNEAGQLFAQRFLPLNATKALRLSATNCIAPHGSVMFRRGAIEKVGTYNEFMKYGEDYELWLRIANHFEVANLQDCLYAWRIHKGHRGGFSLEQFKYNVAYASMARKLSREELDRHSVSRLSENDVWSMLRLQEKCRAYRMWTSDVISRRLQSCSFGRAALNGYRTLAGRGSIGALSHDVNKRPYLVQARAFGNTISIDQITGG